MGHPVITSGGLSPPKFKTQEMFDIDTTNTPAITQNAAAADNHPGDNALWENGKTASSR
jgi:hypothetical protein